MWLLSCPDVDEFVSRFISQNHDCVSCCHSVTCDIRFISCAWSLTIRVKAKDKDREMTKYPIMRILYQTYECPGEYLHARCYLSYDQVFGEFLFCVFTSKRYILSLILRNSVSSIVAGVLVETPGYCSL